VERFWHRLALALGRTVQEAKATVSALEFKSWVEFYGLEPWGEERADLRAGIIASTFANCHTRRGGKPYQPKDFMPRYGPPERMTDEEMASKFAAFAKSHNERVGHGRKA